MKHIYLILILFLCVPYIQAKKVDLKEEYMLLKQQVAQLQEQMRTQQENQQRADKNIEAVKNGVTNLQNTLKQQQTDVRRTTKQQQEEMEILSNKVVTSSEKAYNTIQQNKQELDEKISMQEGHVNSLHNTGKRYVYIVWCLIFGLIGILVWMYWKSKKHKTIIKQLKTQIQKNKDDIHSFFQEQINLCHQILDDNKRHASDNQQPSDFSLALKVADEITLMERNMSHMDSTVKGFKQLKRSIETLKDKLNSQGYEIPELLGKKFNTGMKLTVVSSFPTDTLAPGEEVISKIIKPQVNYQGKMIQSAQVEVSIGEKNEK